jgi:hypothetical protein
MYAMRKNLRESRLGRRGFEALAGLPAPPAAAAPASLPAALTLELLLLPLLFGWKLARSRGPEEDAKPGPAAATDTYRTCSRRANKHRLMPAT